MTVVVFGLILLDVAFNTFAQLALKAAWLTLAILFLVGLCKPDHTASYVITLDYRRPHNLRWQRCGMANGFLSRLPISIAYLMSSLGYITSAIAAYFLLGDNLTPTRLLGIIIIMVGVFWVVRS